MSVEFTKKQGDSWACYQRKKYEQGLLSPSHIKTLQSIPGFYFDLESERKKKQYRNV